jgi:hypothetical protein
MQQCKELREIHVNTNMHALLHQSVVQDVCNVHAKFDNLCPFLVRLADELGITVQALLQPTEGITYPLLTDMCVASE